MNKFKWLPGILLLLVVYALVPAPSLAQQKASRYFPETRHNVQSPFLEFFEGRGGVDIFGFPITDEFYKDGVLMQFFQRVVMEYRPQNPPPYQIQLALLGELLDKREPPIPESEIPSPDDPVRIYFPQTGHTVGYAFLTFFRKHGQEDIFGYPITELVIENNYIVQYFQRARMEWRPENQERYHVQLGLLGSEYADVINLDRKLLAPAAPVIIPTATPGKVSPSAPTPTVAPSLKRLNVSVRLKYPVTGPRGLQTVYVSVIDASNRPVAGAKITIFVHNNIGVHKFDAPATKAAGKSTFSFDIGQPPRGYVVIVEVTATAPSAIGSGRASYLPWY